MLNESFKSNEKVKVSDLESQLSTPGYTIQTIRYLTSRHSEDRFYLCIGFDSFVEFHHWYQWEQILELCQLLVVERPNYENESPSRKASAHADLVSHQPVQVSSSEIRDKISAGKTVENLVPPDVLTIIDEHHLYK